jgi:hypothetical protein
MGISRAEGFALLWLALAPSCGGGGGVSGGNTVDPVTGRWEGSGAYAETNSACNGQATFVLDLLQTGTQLTGNFSGRVTQASETCLAAVGQSLTGSLNGSVAGNAVTFTVDGPVQFTGTRAGNRMQGTFAGRFQGVIDVSGQWTVDKQ